MEKVSVLNLTCRAALSVAVRGSSFVWMAMPWLRADGGRNERNSLADLDFAEKGLNLVFTSVMKRVIIFRGSGVSACVCDSDCDSCLRTQDSFVGEEALPLWRKSTRRRLRLLELSMGL